MSHGEPISAGQGARGESGIRFDHDFDVGKVLRLLQESRDRAGGAGETISTLNLVAIYFSEAAYERARPALEAAARVHPCRMLVLVAEPKAQPESVSARVSVVRGAGTVALERIVLLAQGKEVRHLESAMTALLLPELPRVFVWEGRTEGQFFLHAVESADRIIIDSGTRPLSSLREVAQLVARGAPIGDLAWARIFPWQALAAELLDFPSLREHRGNLQSVRATCAGDVGAEGALLAGWFVSRVKRAKAELAAGAAPEVDSPIPGGGDGTPSEGLATAPVGRGNVIELQFTAPPVTFTLRRERTILTAEVRGDDDGEIVHRVRLPLDTPGRLLSLELKLLSGRDELYAEAAQAAARLVAERWTSS
ncbi:MAG: glucose-6-phosphate dehydrogenase assembly protein OpcA [Myxococcales bacterium]